MLTKTITLHFSSESLTERPTNSGQYIIDPGEWAYDGALNANYRDVEAACIISNVMGEAGYRYDIDFIFLTCGLDKVSILFKNSEAATYAAMKLAKNKDFKYE